MTAKVLTRFDFLNNAATQDGRQHFVIGMDDADGPMLTLTTKIPSGFFFDSKWWWSSEEDGYCRGSQDVRHGSGIRLVLSVQSLGHGLECYTWMPPIQHPALNQFMLSDTTDRVLYGNELFGTLVMKELEPSEFETFRWFDGGTTLHFSFGWRRPQDRDPRWPPLDGEQVAP